MSLFPSRLAHLSIALGIIAALVAGAPLFFTDPQLAVTATMMASRRTHSAPRYMGIEARAGSLTLVVGAYGSVLIRIRFNVALKYVRFQPMLVRPRNFAYVCIA